MKKILLNKNMVALVDDENFDYLNQFKWRWQSGYAARTDITGENILMHREIMGSPKGLEIDHINRYRLDNRKINLRICTHAENLRNVSKKKSNKIGYIGIVFCKTGKRRKRWLAHIRIGNSKRLHLGRFFTKEEAAHAYDDAARKYHGEFASLNFSRLEIYGE